MTFKFLPHTADVKILVEEKTLEKAFITSAIVMTKIMSDKTKIKPKLKKEISVKGENKEALLYDFLDEIVYLFDAKDFILSKIERIEIKEDKKGKKQKSNLKLNATAIGDKASNYKFTNDVKSPTYNEMFIKQNNKNKIITIQFVLDV